MNVASCGEGGINTVHNNTSAPNPNKKPPAGNMPDEHSGEKVPLFGREVKAQQVLDANLLSGAPSETPVSKPPSYDASIDADQQCVKLNPQGEGKSLIFNRDALYALWRVPGAGESPSGKLQFSDLDTTFTMEEGNIVCAIGYHLFVFDPRTQKMHFIGYSSGVKAVYDLGDGYILVRSQGKLSPPSVEDAKIFPNKDCDHPTPRAHYKTALWQVFNLNQAVVKPDFTNMGYTTQQEYTARLSADGRITEVRNFSKNLIMDSDRPKLASGENVSSYRVGENVQIIIAGKKQQAKVTCITPANSDSNLLRKLLPGANRQQAKDPSYRLTWSAPCKKSVPAFSGDLCCAVQVDQGEKFLERLGQDTQGRPIWSMVGSNERQTQYSLPNIQHTGPSSDIHEAQAFMPIS